MSKLNVQLPAVVRAAITHAKYWFGLVGIPASQLNLLRVQCEPVSGNVGCTWVGLIYECGRRYYATYRHESDGPHHFYALFIELWRREQEGWEGQAPVWAKWQWQWEANSDGLRKVE